MSNADSPALPAPGALAPDVVLGPAAVAPGRLPAAFPSLVIFVEAATPVRAVGGAVVLPGTFVARPRAAADASAPRSAP